MYVNCPEKSYTQYKNIKKKYPNFRSPYYNEILDINDIPNFCFRYYKPKKGSVQRKIINENHTLKYSSSFNYYNLKYRHPDFSKFKIFYFEDDKYYYKGLQHKFEAIDNKKTFSDIQYAFMMNSFNSFNMESDTVQFIFNDGKTTFSIKNCEQKYYTTIENDFGCNYLSYPKGILYFDVEMLREAVDYFLCVMPYNTLNFNPCLYNYHKDTNDFYLMFYKNFTEKNEYYTLPELKNYLHQSTIYEKNFEDITYIHVCRGKIELNSSYYDRFCTVKINTSKSFTINSLTKDTFIIIMIKI